MNKIDFNILSHALLLYCETRGSLFAEQIISERSGFPEEEIRSAFDRYFHVDPEKITRYLLPDDIKDCIAKTAAGVKSNHIDNDFISIEVMDDESNSGISLSYQFAETEYGHVIIASTEKGVCYIAFADNGIEAALAGLGKKFPGARVLNKKDAHQTGALAFIRGNGSDEKEPVRLHLKGTPFQISVWKKLLQIPKGGLMSYSALAGNRKDSHALGNAVGSNPVAYIIPCHRAVSASGEFGEYHWGKARKATLICLERYQSALKILK